MTSTLEELGMTLRWSKAERLRAYHFASDAYAVLPVAARALYRDPLWPDLTNGDRLIDWLLTLSPVDDDDTRALRQARELPLQPRQVKPTLDYLQFIRGMRWDKARFSSSSTSESLPPGHPAAWDFDGGQDQPLAVFIRKTLSWAACSRNLENIRHLYVEVDDIPRYTAAAARLQNVSAIYVNAQLDYEFACNNAIRLVKAIHRFHGKGRLVDCRLSTNPFSSSHRVSGDYDMTNILQLYSLFPNAVSPLRIPRTDGTEVVLDRVFDRDLAELSQVEVVASNALRHYYSDLTKGQIMQRFRSASKFSVSLSKESADIFEWAADEARLRSRRSGDSFSPHSSPSSPSPSPAKRMPPAVPVKSLHVTISSDDPPDDIQALHDALHGFSYTMENVTLMCHGARTIWDIEAPALPLTRLRSLCIQSRSALSIHPSFWASMPCLEKLDMDLYKITASHYGDAPLVWPKMHLPVLKELTLRGEAGRMFDPRSLSHMPKLEQLFITGLTGHFPLKWGISLASRWQGQWNWSCPHLTVLEIQANASMVAVELAFLRSCPRLERLRITGCDDERERRPLRIKPAMSSSRRPGSATAMNETSPEGNGPEDPVSNLQMLNLEGLWAIEKDELSYLYNNMCPGLTLLSLGPRVQLVDCTDADLVQITKSHPHCRSVRVAGMKRSTSLRYLGLGMEWRSGAVCYHFANDSGYLLRDA
ncbi:hypothetical protein DFQ27_003035 [Actinomortierella ambigua]|uniref:Uncharacterized protein n=1 Tax=Actinomortierella ambigua TaxID=1343610 RepID=A0A9P6QI99_9FUNG|nr:hypothetical protein DFQ27_003035 [Actinomortierella ambigua]